MQNRKETVVEEKPGITLFRALIETEIGHDSRGQAAAGFHFRMSSSKKEKKSLKYYTKYSMKTILSLSIC